MSHKKAPKIRALYLRADDCQDDDYRNAMNEMTSFSFAVKNVHDDAADSMAMLADHLANGIKTVSVGKKTVLMRKALGNEPRTSVYIYLPKHLAMVFTTSSTFNGFAMWAFIPTSKDA